MGYYDVENAKLTVLDMIKYDAIQDASKVIYKDMGSYLEMLVPMKNSKGHDTYKVYLRANGTVEKVVGDNGNSGFVGTKYF